MKRLKRLRTLVSLHNALAAIALLSCLGMAYWLFTHIDLDWSTPSNLLQSFSQRGAIGIILYVCVQALAIVISPIPGTPLTVAGGAIWGPIQAGIYGVIGIFVGSLMAYFIGRTLGRSAVKALTGKVIYFSRHRGEVYLGWLMFITHLIPILPFDLMSYGAGISGLSFPIYASSTLMGTIPCTFFLTYMGASLRLGLSASALFIGLFVLMVLALPWALKRGQWLNLKDVVRIE